MTPPLAIAAMSLNRVIGRAGRIPWHLPADFRWFKQVTLGGTLVMGRTTFQSIGRPLPGRTTVVLSRSGFQHPDVTCVPSLDALEALELPQPVFICGGAEVYRQTLPACARLYLTLVQREIPDGDTFFPPFEQDFELVGELLRTPDFVVLDYRNHRLERGPEGGPEGGQPCPPFWQTVWHVRTGLSALQVVFLCSTDPCSIHARSLGRHLHRPTGGQVPHRPVTGTGHLAERGIPPAKLLPARDRDPRSRRLRPGRHRPGAPLEGR